MTKRMLIDATHAEETRVVVLDGDRLEDYDVETTTKKQLKGNIYLAKVVRVEPSLQAAFVEYGGNRHGFLAFAEIHPDYYQIPVADRQKLLAMQEAEARAAEEAEEAEEAAVDAALPADEKLPASMPAREAEPQPDLVGGAGSGTVGGADLPVPEAASVAAALAESTSDEGTSEAAPAEQGAESGETAGDDADSFLEAPPPETVGGEVESVEELRPPRIPSSFLRQYKIQEVIHRRQILLVQVVKEERGAKGAALTTYISLAGRYCVLMPNSPRGGGISRKITAPADRRRLKEISTELSIPSGMGLIVRTAGANRPKPDIRRDCEYLLRLWDEIRDTVMKAVAPALIYEEASLIKRAIRDVYSRDIEELLVDGEQGWHAAREFMRTLLPAHARKVQLWKDQAGRSLFAHERVEAELDRVLSPTVALRSGGSLVINQAEALVAIDVNSGRSTRERNIEETALRTNLEAAEEAARQLRLRDLAGLIVIDFIDMEVRKHNAMVERRLKEALKSDRARVQVGHISHFGLLEMSRQRLRPSLSETTFSPCPHCGGTGHVRSVESAAIHLLRMLEDEATHRGGELSVHAPSAIALYILNHKRAWLNDVEAHHGLHVSFAVDDELPDSAMRVERIRGASAEGRAIPPQPVAAAEELPLVAARGAAPQEAASQAAAPQAASEGAEGEQPAVPAALPEPAEAGEEAEDGERRRRRRRRRRRHRDEAPAESAGAVPPEQAEQPDLAALTDGNDVEAAGEGRLPEEPAAPARARRAARGAARPAGPRSGGSRSGEGRSGEGRGDGGRSRGGERPGAQPVPAFGYPAGPTPANPFADAALDLFDAIEAAAEQGRAGPQLHEPALPAPVLPPAMLSEPLPPPEQPALPEPARAEPERMEPEPAGLAEPARAVADSTEQAPPVDDRPPVPAVQPIVLGSDDAVRTEKKRGWWQH